jgi:hypothetical protein
MNRKGLNSWPKGAEWPKEIKKHTSAAVAAPTEPIAATKRLAQAAETEVSTQVDKQQSTSEGHMPPTVIGSSTADVTEEDEQMPSVFAWIGSTASGDKSTGPITSFDEEALSLRDGIGIV